MSEMHQAIHGNTTDNEERCPHQNCGAKWHGLPAGNCPTSFHEYTPENTHLAHGAKRRQCRACNRQAVARYKLRKRAS